MKEFRLENMLADYDGKALVLRAEGKSLRDMLDHAFVYEIEDDGTETLLSHYSALPEPLFALCVKEFYNYDKKTEKEISRAN